MKCWNVWAAFLNTARLPFTMSFVGDHVQWRGPVTGGRANDDKLEHVVELLASYHKAFRSKPSTGGGPWS